MRREVLAALGRLHGAGVVHGDLRCDNILVDASDPVPPAPAPSPRCRSLCRLLLPLPGLQILEGDCSLSASSSIGACGAAGLSRSCQEVVAVASLQTILAAASWQPAGSQLAGLLARREPPRCHSWTWAAPRQAPHLRSARTRCRNCRVDWSTW